LRKRLEEVQMSTAGHRTLKVTHERGTRFEIGVRGHRLFVDQPAGGGGEDSAPTPTELFVASVAGCAAFYGRTYLQRRGLPDRVDVEASWTIATRPDRVGEITLLVDAPGLPADRTQVFERVLHTCLVHNTLTNGCEVSIELGHPELADAL
jgi:putative redox protein